MPAYNNKIILGNNFIEEVINAAISPTLISWLHKEMTESMAHLLCSDETRVNENNQLTKMHQFISPGQIIRAAKEARLLLPY